jgi:hypothetical protein
MTKRIDSFVSENRRDIHKIDSTFIPISGQSDRNLAFVDNDIRVDVSIVSYTRPLNDSLISGHPDGETHGSGYGRSGDQRGDWTVLEDSEASSQFVREGRNILRDALTGQDDTYIKRIAVGSGTGDADILDTSLESETGREFAWGDDGSSGNEITAESLFLFSEVGSDVAEYGVYSGDGRLYNRITTDTDTLSNNEELRVVISFTITGDGEGSSVITDTGEEKIADALQAVDSPIGMDEFAFGSGDSPASESDTSLDTQEFSKKVQPSTTTEQVNIETLIFEDEPSGQPVTIAEVGINDNEGDLLWRVVIEPFDKTEEFEFATSAEFQIK